MSKGFVLHLGLWLALGLSVCQAGERFENSEVCNLDPKNEVSCRENMGWGLHCHERHRCRTKDLSPLEYNSSAMACSDEEIAKRAGHVCEGFPWYNGGYPLHKLKWDEEDEYSKCITPARDGTHCEKWLSSEDSRDEWEAGSCTCDKTKTWIGPNFNRTFCSEWSCEQIEVSKCPPQAAMIDQTSRRWFDRWDWGRYGWSWPYDRATRKTWLQDRFPGYDPSLMPQGPWNFFPYQCIDCQDNCVHVGPEVETERSLCECREDYAGSCVKWFCLEFDDAGRHDVEEEWYTAISLDQNGKVVAEWMGDIESRSEFELSHCHCITVAQSGLYCEEWSCHEKGMAYFHPNVFWVLLHLTLTAVWVFVYFIAFLVCCGEGAIGIFKTTRGKLIHFPLLSLGVAGISLGFLVLGGIVELIVFSSVCVLVLLSLMCLYKQGRIEILQSVFRQDREGGKTVHPGSRRSSRSSSSSTEESAKKKKKSPPALAPTPVAAPPANPQYPTITMETEEP